jgi:hypothetical protein
MISEGKNKKYYKYLYGTVPYLHSIHFVGQELGQLNNFDFNQSV